MPDISPDDTFPRKRLTIGETTMAYVDEGAGDPIIFLHGNPYCRLICGGTSSRTAPTSRVAWRRT